MTIGSITERLLSFCNAFVGRYRGGLAQVNVVQSIVFSSMSGSALADAASSGKLMQKMMTQDGKYPAPYAAALTAVPSLIAPIIPPGITTPTEAAALAAFYALLVSAFLYRGVTWGSVYKSLVTSARVTISIGMLIAAAMAFNYVLTVENIPKTLAILLKGHELTPFTFLLLANLILLVLGCFLEGTTILLIIVPVLLPTAQALGVDSVHFGVIAVVNIMIGLCTPPYGLLLFMLVKIAEVPLRDIVREVMPFLGVMIAALALITFIPGLALFLPRLMGYQG